MSQRRQAPSMSACDEWRRGLSFPAMSSPAPERPAPLRDALHHSPRLREPLRRHDVRGGEERVGAFPRHARRERHRGRRPRGSRRAHRVRTADRLGDRERQDPPLLAHHDRRLHREPPRRPRSRARGAMGNRRRPHDDRASGKGAPQPRARRDALARDPPGGTGMGLRDPRSDGSDRSHDGAYDRDHRPRVERKLHPRVRRARDTRAHRSRGARRREDHLSASGHARIVRRRRASEPKGKRGSHRPSGSTSARSVSSPRASSIFRSPRFTSRSWG